MPRSSNVALDIRTFHFAYIKKKKKIEDIFVILVRLRLESGAVRKLPRILFQHLTHLPPPSLGFPNPSLEVGKGINILLETHLRVSTLVVMFH